MISDGRNRCPTFARSTFIIPMAARRSTSLRVFSFKGISVLVHWTFPLLIGWVVVSAVTEGMDLVHVLQQVLYVLVVFCCVVLHEFGHALTALHYGIRTRNILLLPIGGVATLERMPEKPIQELVVTLAGPAVNLAIVLLVGVPFLFVGNGALVANPLETTGLAALAGFLVSVNIGLFLFNLIPAFPMDGGRILRSLLALRMDRVRATRIASTVGKVFAAAFVFAAFNWQQPMLALIGVFVYFGASAEMRMVTTQRAFSGVQVKEVMRTRFWSMPHDATVEQAAQELLAGGDHVVVVTRVGDFDRLIHRSDIIASVQAGHRTQPLERITGTVPESATPEMDVRVAHEKLSAGQWSLMPVMDQGRLVGVLELENLAEYLELHRAGVAP